jgi:hypothetical protein
MTRPLLVVLASTSFSVVDWGAFSKQPLSAPQDNRIDQQPVLIDQVMLHQRLDKRSAAGDHDVLTGLLLQLGHFFRRITLEQP